MWNLLLQLQTKVHTTETDTWTTTNNSNACVYVCDFFSLLYFLPFSFNWWWWWYNTDKDEKRMMMMILFLFASSFSSHHHLISIPCPSIIRLLITRTYFFLPERASLHTPTRIDYLFCLLQYTSPGQRAILYSKFARRKAQIWFSLAAAHNNNTL